MKPVFLTSLNRKRRQAMALILVIITVALLSMLIVAIFSITRTEYKATQSYVAAKSAKQLGDSAVAIVEAQIQNGQNTLTGSSRKTHATQPGMVRVYQPDGSFEAAYKLYSSANMKVTEGESALYTDAHVPPSTWHTIPARYVDLNEPVVRPALTTTGASSASSYAVYFPIIDPRAAWNYSGSQSAGEQGEITTQVEGFSYTRVAPSIGSGGGQDYSTKVVTNTDASRPDDLRLPMPVEWMYVLQDGTLGVLDASNKFIAATGASGGGAPTTINPIVGRVAFWTDDESCKININTASEPTFMSTPFYYHERDAKWAHFPPATGEYQRYPGHPATVALSAVLAPNYLLDPMLPSTDGLGKAMDVVDLKEQIYKFAPKIAGGGSEGGTRPFVRDDFSSDKGEREASLKINLDEAVKERLYASVDEMLFVDRDYNTSSGRTPAILTLPNSSGNFFAQDRLEHSRFFLTAHSRSPEFSIHGLPRVCMWPVADEAKGAQYRSSFDNAIALCATIKRDAAAAGTTTRSYFFRRANSRNSTADVNLSRNGLLLNYLTTQMSNLHFPATSYSSTTTRSNFQSKYGTDNVNQMAIQFFDYIRCTNLYDGIMARKNNAWAANGQNATAQYTYRDSNESNFYTFTMARITEPPSTVNNVTAEQGQSYRRTNGSGGILPGHGQVSPAIWSKGGRSYKGFGRMFTISEIGFQFMCTADGRPDDTLIAPDVNLLRKFGQGRVVKDPTKGSGGMVARRYDTGPLNAHPTAATAYGFDPELNAAFVPEVDVDQDGINEAYWWSNLPPLLSDTDVTDALLYYGCEARENSKQHPSRHPGFNPANWNMTLAAGTPLKINQKRIQVMLALEAFCPSLGWTGMYPEFTIVLDGATIAQMKLNGYNAEGTEISPQPLFNTTGPVALKSNGNLYSAYDCHMSGGHATPSAFAGGRRTRSVSNGGGIVTMPADVGYDDNNTSGHQALANFQFVSDFITVDRDANLSVTFPNQDISIKIYDTHNWETAQPIQIMHVSFANVPSSEVPMPSLPQSKPYKETVNTNGRIDYTRPQHGPHYWCANYNGCIGLMTGRFNPEYTLGGDQPPWIVVPKLRDFLISGDSAGGNNAQIIRGRLDTAAALVADARADTHATGLSIMTEGDVVRTLVPAIGDYRTLAAMYDVPASWWRPHPMWKNNLDQLKMAHSFTGFWATSEPGAKIALNYRSPVIKDNPEPAYDDSYRSDYQLVGGARFDLDSKDNSYKSLHRSNADLPPDEDYAITANAFGDFDAGVTSAREGPYINKPDEGNFYAGSQSLSGQNKYWRSAYFYETYENTDDWRSGIFITPNRLISSPVMFGSLPTGVFGTDSLPKAQDRASSLGSLDFAPWQTLLFRPHAQITTATPYSNASHPGLQDPSDHYLLDLFFMPVVEPYAISEPLSVAGRINMNYQIMPFINIRRATAMHAVMKGEYITAIPSTQIVAAKNYYPGGAIAWNERFWNDTQDRRYWHRPIDPRSTLRQFDLKFGHKSGGNTNYQGLFRSASQICDMHLIPKIVNNGVGITNPDNMANASSQTAINSTMNAFWGANRVTGDNVRERPYSNLYPRLTTRSNTFRVHVRSQVLRKARSTAADTFDPDKDMVNGEYRGSYLIERFIDPNDPTVTIPDYAAGGGLAGSEPLDAFYRFRTLETKRFNP